MLFKNQILKIYSGIAYNRCDDTGTAYYFSEKDFTGLHKESFVFDSDMGHTLQGYIYSYPDKQSFDDRLVVFDHGFGGGHLAYMREIELLCRHGYTVFAYDHTGCMKSGGENPNGMSQSLHDLHNCLCTLKKNEGFADKKISVVGHSWGAFSTMNICALHPDITHIVAMCGFINVDALISTIYGGILRPWKKDIYAKELVANPEYIRYDAVQSLTNTQTKALLIYSDNDPLCVKKAHYDPLFSTLKNKDNIHFLLTHKKEHNPNYTDAALPILSDYIKKKTKFLKQNPTTEQKKAFVNSFDWQKMTDQDTKIWDAIFAHLDN